MHIVLVLTTGEGGIPHYTAELANALSRNHEVSLVKPETTTADELFRDDVSVYDWFQNTGISWSNIATFDIDPARVLRGALSYRATSRIEELDPDIIHFTHQPHCYLRPLIDTDTFAVPVIETRHEIFLTENLVKIPGRDIPEEFDPLSVHTLTLSADNIFRKATTGVDADGYIVHTEGNRSELRTFKRDAEIAVVPHGSFSVFDSDDADIDTTEDSVLFFGDLRAGKDILQLTEAALSVRDDIEDITVTIAGSGTIADAAMENIENNPDVFEFRNEFIPNEDVGTLFAKHQIVAIPHKVQGGHSGTMTIAFSHGNPVVTTDVGDYDELVRRNGAGYITEPGDSEAMANAFHALLSDERLRTAMSRNARRVGESLSWDSVAEETVEFYESQTE